MGKKRYGKVAFFTSNIFAVYIQKKKGSRKDSIQIIEFSHPFKFINLTQLLRLTK
jgi:hypothetical protein